MARAAASPRVHPGIWFFLVVSLAGFIPWIVQGWRDVSAFFLYEQGRCTVTNLGQYTTSGSKPRGSTSPAPARAHPELMYRVDAAGATYFAFGFDNMNGKLATLSDASSFRVGNAYPCWYDPHDPERAILVRRFHPVFYAGAAIPAFMLIVTSSVLASQLKARRGRRRLRTGPLEPDLTARGRVRLGIVLLLVWTPVASVSAAWVFAWRTEAWFFSVLLLGSVVLVARRFLLFWRARDLPDPSVELDGTRARVSLDLSQPIESLKIALVRDGERKIAYECEHADGSVRQSIDAGDADSIVVIQKLSFGEVETEFRLE